MEVEVDKEKIFIHHLSNTKIVSPTQSESQTAYLTL
jgi:hypothetical protein